MENFRQLALERTLIFDHRRWKSRIDSPSLPYNAMVGWAMENNHIPLLWLLRSPIERPNLQSYLEARFWSGEDILRIPCSHGHQDLLEFLFNYCDQNKVDSKKFLAYHHLVWCASFAGHLGTVKLLLGKGVPANAMSERPECAPVISGFRVARPLELAVYKGHTDIVELLLRNEASVHVENSSGLYPLHYAANSEIVQLLIRYGANVGQKSQNRHLTPLHTAMALGQVTVVEQLLRSGANTEDRDDSGKSPLHYTSDKRVASTILDYNPEIAGSEDHKGNTPMLLAAMNGYTEIVRLLCGRGISLKHQNHKGHTALHKACISGHIEVARQLLAYNADTVHYVDCQGMTPWSHGVKGGHGELVLLLRAHSAKG